MNVPVRSLALAGIALLLLACSSAPDPEFTYFDPPGPETLLPGQPLDVSAAWKIASDEGGTYGSPGVWTLQQAAIDAGGWIAEMEPGAESFYKTNLQAPYRAGSYELYNDAPDESPGAFRRTFHFDVVATPPPADDVAWRMGRSAMEQVTWSPDGKVVLARAGGAVRFYDGTTLARETLVLPGSEHAWFGPEERIYVADTVHQTGWIVHDAGSGDHLWSHPGSYVTSAAFAPDGKAYLAGSDGGIFFVDAATDRPVATLPYVASAVAWAPGGNLVAVASDFIYVLQTQTWTEHSNLSGAGVQNMAFSQDGSMLMVSTGGAVTAYDLIKTVNVWTLSQASVQGEVVTGGTWSPNVKTVWLGTSGGRVERYDDRELVWSALVGEGLDPALAALPLTLLTLSPDGKTIAAALGDELVLVDPEKGSMVARAGDVGTKIWGAMLSPDQTRLALIHSDRISMIDLDGTQEWATATETKPWRLVWSPDLSELAASQYNGGVTIYDAHSGVKLRHHEPYTFTGAGVAWTETGLVLCFDDEGGLIADPTTFEELGRTPCNLMVRGVGGDLIAGLEPQVGIHVCELPSGVVVDTVPVPDAVWFEVTPDGKSMVVAGSGGIDIWDVGVGKRCTLEADVQGPTTFSLDGKQLFGGLLDNYDLVEGYPAVVSVWDAATGAALPGYEIVVDPSLVCGAIDTPSGVVSFGGELVLWP